MPHLYECQKIENDSFFALLWSSATITIISSIITSTIIIVFIVLMFVILIVNHLGCPPSQ